MGNSPRDEYQLPIDPVVAEKVDEAVRKQREDGNLRRANANPTRSAINKHVVHDPNAVSWQMPLPIENDAISDTNHRQFEQLMDSFLRLLGEDPTRNGLLETPRRVADAWLNELCVGYRMNAEDVLKTFDREDTEGGNNVVIVKDLPVYSLCEHHALPMYGVAHVAYLPDTRIVGLSKFKRLIDVYARRLQVQERLTDEVVDAFWTIVKPKGVMVVMELEHMCMKLRGVNVNGSVTITSAVRGMFRDVGSLRQEAMDLIKG